MSTAVEIMGGGQSALGARGINGHTNSAVSAAGTTISDATALSERASRNLVTTVAAGSGVKLPNSENGDEYLVYNGTATNALTVYPPISTATINQLGAGVGVLVSPYTACKFQKISSTAWVAWLSA